MKNNLLRKLNIIGWDELEDFILASLLTGDSTLLVGSPGSAKTYLCYQLAKALGVRFQKIDASKAEFEDLIGFPDPKALAQGRFEYVKTPLSVSDKEFLLIDEINRARRDIQNKLLELIYNRELMGERTKVKWIFAAMNAGEEYSGAEPLEPAFASRFAFILPVPETVNMKKQDIEDIIMNETEVDAIALKEYWNGRTGNNSRQEKNSEIINLLKKAAEEYRTLSYQLCDKIRSYLTCFATVMHRQAKVNLDGRRLSMLRRNTLAYVSIIRAKDEDCSELSLSALMRKVLPYSLPYTASGKPISSLKLEASFQLTEKLLSEEGLYPEILFTRSILEKARYVVSRKQDIFARRKMLNEILSGNKIENLLMPVVLSPFCFVENSPFSLDMRLSIAEKLKDFICQTFDFPISRPVRSIKELKFLQEPQKSGKKKMEFLINAFVKRKGEERNLNTEEKTILKKQVKEFLSRAKRELQSFYEEGKNAES